MVSSRAVATGAGYHNSGYLYPCMRSGRRVEQGKEASGPSAGGGQAAAGVDLDSSTVLAGSYPRFIPGHRENESAHWSEAYGE